MIMIVANHSQAAAVCSNSPWANACPVLGWIWQAQSIHVGWCNGIVREGVGGPIHNVVPEQESHT